MTGVLGRIPFLHILEYGPILMIFQDAFHLKRIPLSGYKQNRTLAPGLNVLPGLVK